MTDFWTEHSKDASIEEMMLDTNASELTKFELPEILSYLPSWRDKRVVELGAGIGRFTGNLASEARTVVAVDFMENFIEKNKEVNTKFSNIEYRCGDVTKLQLPQNSCDLIFSNWLMMYLEDGEVQDLIRRELSWLTDGGYLFARESCYKQSGDKKRTDNPTRYRKPGDYLAMFTMLTVPSDTEGEVFGFDLVLTRPLTSYIKLKQNDGQHIWLLQKTRRPKTAEAEYRTFQEFLDSRQYSRANILRYERIFGRTFISTGGIDTTKDFVTRLSLQPGQIVLDVGCGIGGSAFYMVKEFGVKVVGIDLSSNMINIGIERAREVGVTWDEVQLEVADATRREYKAETFDVIYSRDTILHIPDKLALFKKFYRWLKVGGKLFITDYCCSDGEHSEHFKAYVKQRGYTLMSPQQYGQVLEAAGFSSVQADDRTDLFVSSMQKEVSKMEDMKQDFIQEFSQENYDHLIQGWHDKLRRTEDQRWGVFYAEKH